MKPGMKFSSRCLLGTSAVAVATLAGCLGGGGDTLAQPEIGVRSKTALRADGYSFRDANPSSSGWACSRTPTSPNRQRPRSSAAKPTAPRAWRCRSSRSCCCRISRKATAGRCRCRRAPRSTPWAWARPTWRNTGYTVTDGNYTTPGTRPSATGHDFAVIRVQVSNVNTAGYRSKGATTGADSTKLNPRTGNVWGAQDPCVTFQALNPVCVDDGQVAPNVFQGLLFGGALPWEANNLSFTTMAASQSWRISPSLADIQAVMNEVGANKVVLSIYLRNPYVLDDASGLKNAGAILANFGVSDAALLEVISGKFKPQGKLPFTLANNLQAVIDNQPDAPGYPPVDTLFSYGFGLSY